MVASKLVANCNRGSASTARWRRTDLGRAGRAALEQIWGGLAVPVRVHTKDRPPPAWWCGASKTPATAQADIVDRRHAIIETVFADLIDGPLAHLPSGHFFGANFAWALCAAIAHNLLHAAGTLTGKAYSVACGVPELGHGT